MQCCTAAALAGCGGSQATATARRRLLVSARASSEPQDERQTEVDWGKGATVFDSGHDSHEQSRGFGIIERPADPAVDGTPRWFVCDWDHQRAGARSKPIKQTYLELPLVPRHKRVAPKALQQRVLVILGNSKGKEGKTVQKCGGMWSVQLDGGKERQPFLPAYLHATAPPPADTTLNAFEPKVLTSLLAAEVPAYIERLRFAPDAPVDLHRKLPTSGCMMDLLTGAREVDSLSDQELRNLSGRAAGCPDKPSGSAEDPLTPAGRAAIADGLRQAVAGRWTIKMVCAQASTSSACGCPYALEFKHKGDGSVTVTQTEAHQFHDPSDAASLAKLKMHPALQAMGQVLLRCGVKPLQVCSELNAAALEDGVLGSGSSGLLMASNARGSITLDQVKALAKQVRRAQGLSVTSDSSALAAAVAAYREQGAVPFYQPYRAATKDTGEQPLIIILQTPWQARMLDQFGRTLTFADSTYGTNWAGYPLYACTVQDDVGRGVPAGFMICSSDTVEVVEHFFRTLQEGAQKAGKEVGGKGDFKYGYIMIDKSSTEIAAVRQLVLTGDAKGHLLCYFHYLQDWERFVTSKVSGVSKEEKNGIMVAMADLQKCGSETVFKEQLKTLYHQYRRWPQVVAHLKKDWAPCGQEWAAWGEGRQDPRVAAMECETNNLCERAFGLVKYGDLGGKAQSSIPELVFVLLTRTVPRYMQQRAHQLVGRASSDQVQRSERVQRVVEKLASSGAVLPFPGEEEQGSKGFASVRCDTGGAMVCLGDMSCNCSYSEDHLCVHIKAAASVMSFTHQRRMAAAAFLVESGGIDVGEAGICTCAMLADTSRKQTFRPQEGYCTCLDRQLHGTCAHLLAALLLEAFNGMELPQGPPQVAGEENKPIEISGPRTFQQASIEPLGERWQEEVKGLRAAKQASAVTIRQSQTNADPVIAEMRHSCAYVQRVVAALPADCEERAGLREGLAKLAEQAAAAEAALQLQPTAVRAGKQQRRQAGRHADDRVVKPLFPSRAKRGASLPAPAQPLAEEDRCDPLPRLTKRGKAVHKARGVTVPGNLDGTVLRNGAAHHRVPKRQRRLVTRAPAAPTAAAAAMAPRKRKAAAQPGEAEPAAEAPPAAEATAAAAAAGAAATEMGGSKTAGKAAKPKAKRAPAKPKAPAGPAWEPSMRPPPLGEDARILSWNVAGLRALLKKVKEAAEGKREEHIPHPLALAEQERADVLCLQEIKLQDEHCSDALKELRLPDGWHATWNCSQNKKGYSGTAILSREEPLSVSCGIGMEDHDGEGRVVTAEFPDFFLVNCYVPNSGEGLKRLDYRVNQWDKEFAAYLKGLEARKPVVLTGDLNVAPTELDIHNPKGNLKSAGFTPEERASFQANLLGAGFVDCFRAQYPGAVAYTYWGYRFNARANNKGWRLDHFLVSSALAPRVHDCYHLPHVMGSDHCPLGLVLKL
ncbi:hypothetical protein ABPG75_003713 [Micractinium tetrahymenae]